MSPAEPLHGAARLETADGEPVCFLGASVNATLRGALLDARVEQCFCNPTAGAIEVVYRFPLPWGAVLLGVDVVLGGRRLSGQVAEKVQAQAGYEEALSEGNAALLLVCHADGSHGLNLGNLAAGEACTVSLRYAQMLAFEQGGLRVVIPTVIAPRYGDPVQGGGLAPHMVAPPSLLAEHPFTLSLQLHGALAGARIASPSHPIAADAGEAARPGGCTTVTLARQAALDRDFVLVLDQLADPALALAARDGRAPGGAAVAVMASFCPRLGVPAHAPVAVKMLVDCSGSMAGDSMHAARRALSAIVQGLLPGDRFSLSRFGTRTQHRSSGLWRATQVTRLAAQHWVNALDADLGGTEMEAALRSTFALGAGSDAAVLLITDGGIEAIDATLAAAQASGHRVFVVGIGASPAEGHLRRLAQATGAACDFVAPGEAVEPAVLRMFARLRSPRLTQLSLQWPPGVGVRWHSPLPLSAFDGDSVQVLALLDAAPEGSVSLCGQFEGAGPHTVAQADWAQAPDGVQRSADAAEHDGEAVDTLARMVASARIVAIEDVSSAEATALAVAYQLVTQHTHFLMVHERATHERAHDMPALHAVQPMLAAGWGGAGSVLYTGAAQVMRAVPSVWRAHRRSSSILLNVSDQLDDTPAWSRTDMPAPASSPERVRRTPAEVIDWLHATAPAQWPSTYEGLMAIGLALGQITGLRRIAEAHPNGPVTEATLVQALLLLLSHSDMRDGLADIEQLSAAVDTALAHLHARWGAEAGAPLPDWTQALALSLLDLRADRWPAFRPYNPCTQEME